MPAGLPPDSEGAVMSVDGGARRAAGRPPQARTGRVLMLLFHFPPVNAVSTPRNARNVQYLPRHGWMPVVVTPRETSEPRDPDAHAVEGAGVRVVRTSMVEPRHLHPLAEFVRRVGRRARAIAGRRPTTGAVPRPAGPERAWGSRGAEPMATSPGAESVSRILRFQRLLFFPDNQVGWLPFAVLASLREHRARPVDVIYSTSAPYTAHLAGGILKRLTGRPWVAEFRDPWVGSPVVLAVAGPRPWLHRRLQVKVERWIVRTADRVVFVSPSTAALYRRRYPDAPPFAVITNGHDPADIVVRAPDVPRSGPFRIVWAGTTRPSELATLLAAVASLAARRPTLPDELELVFYGEMSEACLAVIDRHHRSTGLGRMIIVNGQVPRKVALAAVAGADAALVMLGGGPGMGQYVPGKVFDCVGQSQQVLAILPPGDARDILLELNWGVIAEPDPVDVERALEQLLAAPSVRGRIADPEGRYDRARLTGRLAETLREAAGAGAEPGAEPRSPRSSPTTTR